ncbi:Cytochrome P450 4F1 [Trichoplax sp. H2]|nr:Cytochrome P450 4F1 [Trichoplax sp. H2]|eukprot:RDD37852.1 Cytochrome P450 4F1 [Trichoplax sp. H2]
METNRIWAALRKVPGPKAHWLLGNLDDVGTLEDYLEGLTKLCQAYPNMFPIWYGITNPTLVLSSPLVAKKFIKPCNTKETVVQRIYKEWTGSGLLFTNGKQWSRNRKLLTPGFHFDILKTYLVVYNECIDILMNKWSKLAVESKPFEVREDMSLCTFDIILQCACSTKLNPQAEGFRHRFLTACHENSLFVEARAQNPLYVSKLIYKLTTEGKKFYSNVHYCKQFAKEIILERQADLENQDGINEERKHLDFLDILLTAKDSDGVGMTLDEMADEVITFLFAGHDTTSTSISWLLYSLASNPDYQKKCQEEIDNVLGDRTEIAWEDLSSLPYLTLCIKESQRLHTTVPLLGYTLAEDMTVGGVKFPKGMDIEVPAYVYHHDSRWWKDPWTYDPLRFTPENSNSRDAYAYIPFAIGSRNCIGQNFAFQEVKAVAARILQRFDIATNQTTFKHIPGGVLKSQNGIWISLKERK